MNLIELKQGALQLKEHVTDKKPPYWEYWRWELWKHLTEGDDPFGFMSWPCIYHTMLVNHWKDAVTYEYHELDLGLWESSLKSPHRFFPWDFFGKTTLSRNLIHQAYHIHVWEQKTGKRIEDMETIVEFGGGYGAMALLCRRVGFRGTYYIYDLPEFVLLQKFFLTQEGVQGVKWPKTNRKKHADLLMGIYSLSEVSLPVRNNFLEKVTADSYLLLYSGNWEEYDNIATFPKQSYLAENWDTSELQHLPDLNNWYTVGW